MTYQNRTLSGGGGNGHPPADDAWLELVPRDAGGMSIDPSHLQVGDLIVSTTTAWISERIRTQTRAPVSHVAIYLGDGQVIEAIGQGVSIHSLDQALADDYYAAAFRVDGLTDAARTALDRWLRSQVGRRYDLRAIVSLLRYQNPEQWYCSELVFFAFEHIGMPLVPAASRSVPGDVLRITGVTYLGHLKYPPHVMSQAMGPFTPTEAERDAMVPPASSGMSIEPSILQVGDLVVTSSDSPLGEAIRTRTGEPASHVALYIGDGEVVEAIGQGVTRQSLTQTLNSTYYAAAYRYLGLSPQEQTAIRNFALSKLGQRFDVIAIGSLQRSQDANAWFCSELVFEAYASAGIQLGDSARSSPGQIITLQGFEYVGHLPTPGYVGAQSLRRPPARTMTGGMGAAIALADLAVGITNSPGNADVTYSFDQMRGKYSKLVDRWSNAEQVAHDTPSHPYQIVSLSSTHKHWDLGTIGATVPISFEYNGYYISNLRLEHPIDVEETFGYKLNCRLHHAPGKHLRYADAARHQPRRSATDILLRLRMAP